MSRVTFIHTADIHLDTPFKGLSEIDRVLADRLRRATFQSFCGIVDRCLQEPVDFLLIAGDTFDGEARSLSAQLGFAEELRRLCQAGIPVYLVFGNHDPADDWIKEIALPENVHRFSAAQADVGTFSRNGQPLADIHGLSFDSRAGDRNPAAFFRKNERPAPFSIGLVHGTIGPAGPHAPYQPFTAADILDKGFDYWALGHVHRPGIIQPADPAIVYPGNPQGRDFGETGARGCFLVTLETGRKPALTFLPTQTVRFETMAVDLSDLETLNQVMEKIEGTIADRLPAAETADCVLRIVLRGRTPLHTHLNNEDDLADLARRLNETRTEQPVCFIDRLESETLPDIDLESLARGNDFPAEVLRAMRAYAEAPAEADVLIRDLAAEFATPGIRKELSPPDAEDCRRIMALAQRRLLDLFFT